MTIATDPMVASRIARPVFIKVWDPFVRLFHWSLVALFATAWITADAWDRVHEYSGYAIAVLVGLRIVWGVFGSRHARFTDFLCSPSAVMRYLKEILWMRARRYLGHNPAGGAMVAALLLTLTAAVATGVMSTMDRFWGVDWVGTLHETTATLTLVLVFLHVAGVLLACYQHRENLVRSMLTGMKRSD